jgi:hypothetical protein
MFKGKLQSEYLQQRQGHRLFLNGSHMALWDDQNVHRIHCGVGQWLGGSNAKMLRITSSSA